MKKAKDTKKIKPRCNFDMNKCPWGAKCSDECNERGCFNE